MTPQDETKTDPDVPIVPQRALAAQVGAVVADVSARGAVEAPQAPVRIGPPASERPEPPPGYRPPDFDRVLQAMGVGAKDRDHLARAEGLLRSLRQEGSTEVNQQIVRRTLEAFGETLGTTAARALAALDGWIATDEQELRSEIDATQRRILELRAEEQRLAAALSERQATHRTRVYDTRTRQAQLRHVVEFFGDEP